MYSSGVYRQLHSANLFSLERHLSIINTDLHLPNLGDRRTARYDKGIAESPDLKVTDSIAAWSAEERCYCTSLRRSALSFLMLSVIAG